MKSKAKRSLKLKEHHSVSEEFQNQVLNLLCRRVLTLEKAEHTLNMLRKKFPSAEVSRHFFHLLTNLTFSEAEAEKHWKGLRQYHNSIQKRLHISLDLRVSTLGYFLLVCKKLKNPKFIELKLYMRNQSQLLKDELTGLYNFRHFKEILPWGKWICVSVWRRGNGNLVPGRRQKAALRLLIRLDVRWLSMNFHQFNINLFMSHFSGSCVLSAGWNNRKALVQMADEAGYFSKGNGKSSKPVL
ncbi:MAG: hypothetical protein IPK04_19620 [Bdellovibrionales bacterium]|nr:hypothetical protein [Bdellovibrionales bacterium]